jgi:hypothetical protein
LGSILGIKIKFGSFAIVFGYISFCKKYITHVYPCQVYLI